MANIEITGKRESDMQYSRWRRLVNCKYPMDIDMVEWRPNRGIVGLMEVKSEGYDLSPFQYKVYGELSEKLNVPAYKVVLLDIIDGVPTKFEITNLKSMETRVLTSKEWEDHLKKL